MLTLALALSLAGLVVGPLLVAAGRGRALALSALDGLTLGLLPVLLLTQHLPHVVEEIGLSALGATALGYAGLWLAERRRHRAGALVGRELVVSALAVHGFADGAGLALAAAGAEAGNAGGALLGVALLVHRMPEGLFLATAVLPEVGWSGLLRRLALVGLATVAGGLLGQGIVERLPHGAFEGFVALGLGAMLRMALHSHAALPRTRGGRRVSGLLFVAGLALALALPEPAILLTSAHERELPIVASLGPLFVETAPSLLLGVMAAGLLHAYLPRHLISWLGGGSRLSQAARGMLFGLPLPICSCGVLPLSRRLLAAGVPAAAVIAFAIGAPELDVGSAVLSVRLLGWPAAMARIVGSMGLALVVALMVAAVAERKGEAPGNGAEAEGKGVGPREDELAAVPAGVTGVRRLRGAIAEAFGPTLDHVAAWYVVGLVIAAAFEALVDPGLAAGVGAPIDVIASALIAVPVYVCAQGATPLAAVMIHKGFSVGAALTFLLVGPATNVAVLAVLRRALGMRAAVAFAAGSIGCGIVAGFWANAVLTPASMPEIHALVAHDHEAIEWLAAGCLGALLIASLIRLGPRDWFGTMSLEGHDHDDHAHESGHAHEHAHGHGHGHGHGHAHAHAHAHGHDHAHLASAGEALEAPGADRDRASRECDAEAG